MPLQYSNVDGVGKVADRDHTADEVEAVEVCGAWWDDDSAAKLSLHTEYQDIYRLYTSDHWGMTGPDGRLLRTPTERQMRPNCVENVTLPYLEGIKAEFATGTPEIVFHPVDRFPNDEQAARKRTGLTRFIMEKNRLAVQYADWLHNFLWYGTGIWHLYWDPHWSGGRGPNRWLGDIRWESLHPQLVFPDCRCGDSIQDGYRLHKAVYRPMEYVRERYPEFAHMIQEDVVTDVIGEHDLFSLDVGEAPSVEGMVRIIETWYRGRPLVLRDDEKDMGIGLNVIWWASDSQKLYLTHQNYVYYEPNTTTQFPFFLKPKYAREGSPFGYGEAHHLKMQQIVVNKESEILLEAEVHSAVGQRLYTRGALTPAQRRHFELRGTFPNALLECNSLQGIRTERGQGGHPSTQQDILRRTKVMEGIVGRHDVVQGKTPGSVTAFSALNLLAQQAQTRQRLTEQAIRAAFEDCGQLCSQLIDLMYTEQRTYRIMGDDPTQPAQYERFDPTEHRQVWLHGTTEPMDANMVDTAELDPGTYEVYCPEYDTKCRMGYAMPNDRGFYLDLATQLFMAGMITPKTFFSVLEEGRFPAWEVVGEEVEQLFAQRQAMAAGGAQQQGPQQPAGGEAMAQLPPEIMSQIGALGPEEQQQVMAGIAAMG